MEIPAGSSRRFTRSVPPGADICRFHYEYATIQTHWERRVERFVEKVTRALHLRAPSTFSAKTRYITVEFHE
jgi:hypothetical protein